MIAMFQLTEKRFLDFFRTQPETGMGYCVATTILKDGREFPQTLIDGDYISLVRHHREIPFGEADIDRFVVTHDRWNWSKDGR